MREDERPPKLNIFALPNQAAILVILLACVLYGTLIAIGASAQPIVFRLLTFALLVLSLRRLLSLPEFECVRNKLVLADEEFGPLQELIARLAHDLELPRIPQLMLSPDNDELRIFGSWRRWYITMGEDRARVVLEMLREGTDVPLLEAAMLHELCHFRNRDHLWTGYARMLLRAGFWLMLWTTVMLVGILGLLGLAQQAIFETHSPTGVARRFDAIMPGMGQPISSLIYGSTEAWQRAREQAARVDLGQALFNQFINTFPLALFGGGLLLVFWQRLMRTREIYADAGVVQVQGRIDLLLKSTAVFGGDTVAADPANAPRPLIQAIIEQARAYWRRIRKSLVRHYLGFIERWEYLREPQRIYGGWRRNALLIGFFTLVLDLTFLGTSALFYVGEWPLHFPILAAYILIVLALLTPIVMGQPVWRDMLKIVGVVTIIRFVFLLVSLAILNMGFVLFPDLLARILDVWARALAGFAGLSPGSPADDLHTLVSKATRVNLLQIPVVFATLLLASWLSAALARRMLTWYGFPGTSTRMPNKIRPTTTAMRVIYLMFALVTIAIAFVVLPLVTDLVVERLSVEVVVTRLVVAAVALLIVLPFAIWLWRLDRRYAGRCPTCLETIPGYYVLGRRCDRCGQLLNPWLLTTYDVESVR